MLDPEGGASSVVVGGANVDAWRTAFDAKAKKRRESTASVSNLHNTRRHTVLSSSPWTTKQV